MEWKLVSNQKGKKIGAVGFIDNRISAVATFYADKDWNHDGKIDPKEKFGSLFGLGGKALTEVITAAIEEPSILERDPHGLRSEHGKAIQSFASSMILEGIYITYLKMGVSKSCGALAEHLVNGSATRFFVRKGMEKAVKAAYDSSSR